MADHSKLEKIYGIDSKGWPSGAVVIRCTRSLSGELDVAEFPIIMGEKLGLACES